MLQPIVLSGGSGSRLWPLSREQQPKQLLKLFGEFSMLQSTILRLADFSGDLPISRKPIVVCNQSYRFVTAEQLQEIKVSGTVMLEPCARNTAPALTVAAHQTIASGHASWPPDWRPSCLHAAFLLVSSAPPKALWFVLASYSTSLMWAMATSKWTRLEDVYGRVESAAT